MITGFILVSVMCLEGIYQDKMVAGVPTEKINCTAMTNQVYKTRSDCEADNVKQTNEIRVNRAGSVKKIIVMPGSACVHINKIVGESVEWKVD